METEPLNWLALGIGVVASFLFGWLVYSPIAFGKGWAEGSGVKLGSANDMPVAAMVAQLVALALLAGVIALTAQSGALWTAALAVAAAAMFAVSNGLFVKKSTYALGVDAFYIAGSGIIMIVVQALF